MKNKLIEDLKQDLSTIEMVEELIEKALELDRGMYECLPKKWRNPGIAGLCALRLLKDVASLCEKQYSDEVKDFLEKIDYFSQEALKLIEQNKEPILVKRLINKLYESNVGFIASDYTNEKFSKIKMVIQGLPKEGQLVYRESDGVFFILVDNRYVTEVCSMEGVVSPQHLIGCAHITINEGMTREDSYKLWERLSKQLGETTRPIYKASEQVKVKYLNKTIKFEVIGGYDGSPKTNSRQFLTKQLEVNITEAVTVLIGPDATSKPKNYRYHITFGEKVRKQYYGLNFIQEITEVLIIGSPLSKQLCDILKDDDFKPAIKKTVLTAESDLELLLKKIKLLLRNVHEITSAFEHEAGYDLIYQSVPGDGHCLYNAVALYCGLDQKTLRNIVASHIRHNFNEYQNLINGLEGSNGRKIDEYLKAIEIKEKWADNLEIEVLMKILNRPIIIVESNNRIRNLSNVEDNNRLMFTGEPIFIYYNGHNHYDALIRRDDTNISGIDIFNKLKQGNINIRKLEKANTTNAEVISCTYLSSVLNDLPIEYLAEKTQELDEVLYNYLPQSIKTPSLSGFISMQIIYSFIYDKKEFESVEQYSQKINAITKVVEDYFPIKWKGVNLQFWIDKLFSLKNNFNRDQHEAAQAKTGSTVTSISLQKMLELTKLKPFSENIQSLFQGCDEINILFEKFKKADKTKKNETIADCLLKLGDFGWQRAEKIISNIYLGDQRRVAYNNRQIMLTYALMFYNAALNVCEHVDLKRLIDDTNRCILAAAKGEDIRATEFSFVTSENGNIKTLCDLRATFDSKLKNLEETLKHKEVDDTTLLAMTDSLQEMTNELVIKMKKFMGELITQSIELLGPAPDPDSYAFIGFGSLEKQTCTPYSDWEFAILLKEHEDTEQKRLYFRNLSYVLQAKVINLRETPIPFSLFNYSFDHLTGKGFSYDLGGKTPLGRCYDDANCGELYGQSKYELIGNPNNLAAYLDDDFFRIDKFLPIEVASCTHIFGEQCLTKEFQKLVKDKLLSPSKNFRENGRNLYQERAIIFLNEDLWRYTPRFSYYEAGKIYDVKKEIYRIPDRIIDNLAFFYKINQGSITDKIKFLVENKLINSNAGVKLRIICGIANSLRLITYKHYHEQNDRAWVVGFFKGDQKHKEKESFYLESYKKLLNIFYYTAIPFCKKLNQWMQDQTILLSNYEFYDCRDKTKAQVCIRLYDYQEAKKHLEQQYLGAGKDLSTLRGLGFVSMAFNDLEGALKYYNEGLDVALEIKDQLAVGEMRTNIANVYGRLGRYEQEKEGLQEALDNAVSYYGEKHISVAVLLNNLGNVYNNLGNYSAARALLEQAMPIIRNYGKEHIWIAAVSQNLGNTYKNLGDYKKAKELLEQSLNNVILYYGEEHSEIATILNDVSNVHSSLGDYKKAKELLEQALNINIKHFGKDSEQVARNYDHLGSLCGVLGDYEKQKELLEKALDIKRRFYQNEEHDVEHVEIAITLQNLSKIYIKSGDKYKVTELLEQSLKSTIEKFGEKHIKTAKVFDDLGEAYREIGNYEKQKELLEKALDIKYEFYQNKEHIDIARTLILLGNAYIDSARLLKEDELKALKAREQANELLKKALTIHIKFYGEQHIKVSIIYYYIACNCIALYEHSKPARLSNKQILMTALELLKKSLSIHIIHYGEQHIEVAEIYFRLGILYYHSGNHEERQNSLEKALEIYMKNFYPKTNYIRELFVVLNDLSNIYGNKRDHKEQKNLLEQALELDINFYEEPYVREAPNMFKVLNSLYNFLKENNNKQKLSLIQFKMNLFLLSEKIFTNSETAHLFKEQIQQQILTEEKDMINFIIAKKGDINARKEENGMTIFMIACSLLGNVEVIQELINKKADIHAKASRGETALTFAFTSHTPTVLTCLLGKEDCDIDVTDDDKDYPEVWAVQKDLVNNLQAAIERQNIGIERIEKNLEVAKEEGSKECEHYLENYLKTVKKLKSLDFQNLLKQAENNIDNKDAVVEYDSKNKILYFTNENTYNWSKSVFIAAKLSGFIGDIPLPEFEFSFCEQKKYIKFNVSDDDNDRIFLFLKNILKENNLTIEEVIEDIPSIFKETSPKLGIH